ncbi:hypothetical protein DPMN_063510 [Dreissena polymorpha]|uniref:Uncharacterized protein n=1 Tax=Dreissena polymorpha TaxID=45954 RepID=A0A9D4CB40_DREPO|nr:hypothetical protein DPMN_063510 [Dreissena polymorpha]
MNRESPGRTGNDRQGTGKNRDCTENYRDGTLAAALPGSDAGIAPVIVGVVTVYRGSAGFHRVQPFRLDVHAHSEARHLLHCEMAVCSNCKLHVICPEMDTETSLSNLYIIFVLRCATNTYSVRNLYIKRLVVSFETKHLDN